MRWRIYYGDDSTFSDKDGLPCQAPGVGVACIVQPDEQVGRTILHRWDWYYWHGGYQQWWGGDIHGVVYQFTHDREGVIDSLKQGVMLPTEVFEAILKRAVEDPNFPTKSATKPLERCEALK